MTGLTTFVYRCSLYAFPSDVRREHGAEMLIAFTDMLKRLSDGGRLARWRFVARAFGDVIREGTLERLRRVRDSIFMRRPAYETRRMKRAEGGGMMGDFMDDVRLTFRSLFRSRGVSTVLVLTLALGIGSSTAVFSVFDGVLLRPLPYDQPDELITMRHELTEIANVGLQGIPGPDLLDYMAGAPSIESLGSIIALDTNLNDGQGAARVTMAWITPNFFDVLGTDAAVGRMLQPDDWIPRTRAQMEDPAFTPPPMPVMLSNEMWSARFAADPDLIGKSVTINGTQMTVIGILPPGFRVYAPANTSIPSRIDAYSYVPLPMTEGARGPGQGLALARIVDGATIEQATAELERVAASLVETHERHAQLGTRVVVDPLLDGVVGEARPVLWILFGSIGLVLLIAILNVANLLLVEAGARREEFAVRIALGVDRLRLVRQLLTENLIIAGLGAVAGLWVATLGVRALVALAPPDLPRVGTIGIDGGVLLFTVATSAVAALIFGVAPAVSVSRVDPATLLSARGSIGAGKSGARIRNSLIVGEVALSVLLVAGAGLLLRSFSELSAVNPGYDPEGAVALEVALPFFTYRDLERRQGFFNDLLERSRALPGVDAAGISPDLPLTNSGDDWSGAFGAPGADLDDPDAPRALYRAASSGFFEALGVQIVAGRAFEVADGEKEAELVVLIDRRLAEAEWPAGDAVGSSIEVGIVRFIGPGRQATARIVGVVESVRYSSLMEADEPTIWIPFHEYAPLEAALVLRGPGDPVAAAAQIRQVLNDLDPTAPVYALRALTDDVRAATARSRYALVLMAIFAMSALLLAAVGLYGVVSYAVQQRTREIGVRIALGARTGDIGAMVLAQGVRLTVVGGVLGIAGALMVGPLLESLLYEVNSWDPITLLGTSTLLVIVATVAAWFPAVRASRVDPIKALTTE